MKRIGKFYNSHLPFIIEVYELRNGKGYVKCSKTSPPYSIVTDLNFSDSPSALKWVEDVLETDDYNLNAVKDAMYDWQDEMSRSH